ncbi:hypothetical protein ALQ76_00789 [Pseudomonas syringae pv. atrofaciens]|nr:hypothetical protein ALQ76_00789 [Pseudomonas syringae pv. atrofaciens]
MQPTRRSYSKSFKAQVIQECAQPGALIASIALSHSLNVNLVHKWIRLARADGELLGIAGQWGQWRDPSTDHILHSYTMLTVNADDHDFMKAYHKP